MTLLLADDDPITLDACIAPEDAAAPTIIETVRGAGYRFRPRGV